MCITTFTPFIFRNPSEETEAGSESGTSTQNHPVLTTTYPYYTATGSSDSNWTLGETCIETEPAPDCNGDVLEVCISSIFLAWNTLLHCLKYLSLYLKHHCRLLSGELKCIQVCILWKEQRISMMKFS